MRCGCALAPLSLAPWVCIPHLSEQMRRISHHRVALVGVQLPSQVGGRRQRGRWGGGQADLKAEGAAIVKICRVCAKSGRDGNALEVEKGWIRHRPIVPDVEANLVVLGGSGVEANGFRGGPGWVECVKDD